MNRFNILILLTMIVESLGLFLFHIHQLPFLSYLLLHLLACCGISMSLKTLQDRFKTFTSPLLYMMLLFTFFMPVLGVVAVFIMTHWICRAEIRSHIPLVQNIELDDTIQPLKNRYGVGGLR